MEMNMKDYLKAEMCFAAGCLTTVLAMNALGGDQSGKEIKNEQTEETGDRGDKSH